MSGWSGHNDLQRPCPESERHFGAYIVSSNIHVSTKFSYPIFLVLYHIVLDYYEIFVCGISPRHQKF